MEKVPDFIKLLRSITKAQMQHSKMLFSKVENAKTQEAESQKPFGSFLSFVCDMCWEPLVSINEIKFLSICYNIKESIINFIYIRLSLGGPIQNIRLCDICKVPLGVGRVVARR